MHFCLTIGDASFTTSPTGDNINKPMTIAMGNPITTPMGIDFKCSRMDNSLK